MDSKLKFHVNTESFKEKLTRSTVFQATIEQAQIHSSRTRLSRDVLNINRESTSLRSSSTFQSSVFAQDNPARRRENSYKPKDNISVEFFGNDRCEFYRKSVVSDFQPDFQPKFSYQSTWEVDSKTFQKKSEPLKENWFKPIRKENNLKSQENHQIHAKIIRIEARSVSPQRLAHKNENFAYIRSTQGSTKATSRPSTPSRNPIIFTDPGVNTEESWTTRVETEPDRYYKSILRENHPNDCRNRRTDESFQGSVIEKNFWDSSKEVQEFGGNENKYEKVLQAWRNHKILCAFSGTPQEKVPSYMRKTISSLCKSKKLG